MNISRMGRRLAVSGVATAIAAAGLVGASTSAANAAAGTSTYTCDFPVIGSQQLPVDATVPDISAAFPAIPAGLPLDKGSLPASFVFHANPTVAALLPNVTGLSTPDFGVLLGDQLVPVADFALGAPTADTDPGSLKLPATGTNAPFSIPGAGTYALTMPKSFTLTGTALGQPVSVPCTTDSPALLDTLNVVKNPSMVSAKAPAKVKKGKVAKIAATVAGGVTPFSGKVNVFDGKKKLGAANLSSAGSAVYKAKGLKVGKHVITVKYAGDAFRTAGKSKAVVVKVVK
jgi:hypothetical protein